MAKLFELADIISGIHFTKNDLKQYVSDRQSPSGFLQLVDFKDQLMKPVNKFLLDDYRISPTKKIQDFDIVIPKLRTDVESVLFDFETFSFLETINPEIQQYYISESMFIIRPKEGVIDPYFLSGFINSHMGYKIVDAARTNNTMPSLSLKTLSDIEIPDYPIITEMGSKERRRHCEDMKALQTIFINSQDRKNEIY